MQNDFNAGGKSMNSPGISIHNSHDQPHAPKYNSPDLLTPSRENKLDFGKIMA
jgi:hypothetical protein